MFRNENLNPNPLWGMFQNGPARDVVKAAVKQPQKPQTRGLFSDDEDAQVKHSGFTGESYSRYYLQHECMCLCFLGISCHPKESF